MNQATRYGIIGFLTLLLGSGATLLLLPGEKNNAYYCNATGEIGIFYGGLSISAYRAYPFLENGTGYKDCINRTSQVKSVWVGCDKIPGVICIEQASITKIELSRDHCARLDQNVTICLLSNNSFEDATIVSTFAGKNP